MTQELKKLAKRLNSNIIFLRNIIEHRNFLYPNRENQKCGLNCIKDDHDYYKLCNSLDILEDSMEALFFYLHTIDQTRKACDFGETYLRFYGIISAVYSQKNATYGLAVLVGAEDTCRRLDALDVIEIRNTILVHFTKNKKAREESYSVSRGDLTQGRVIRTGNGISGESSLKVYNLDNALGKWIEELTKVFSEIIPKIINNLDQFFNKDTIVENYKNIEK